ncbi:probable RIB4-6,7-dimethyl-8-ribityllumazine synthase [Ramularia collo-cygni]|uniref:6,7-dimethyl-8-ribityllumazine synthase n=1 Tax=Ramularia collo-cygni TaxID=112498 RepID=A0A2D3V935_9PEZI|nr:probable RIB4-6,7-dimethyl-8-ribityllumazine synthase [Ramularia collo-cygni]CZT18019.1 probable RIB4-6,7-dimethyl-8-ribityllumazine synthase [Ramularia collo-cygni]
MATPTTTIKGPGEARTYDGSALRIGIVHARWNDEIISALLSGIRKSLTKAGVLPQNIVLQSVPGSYELPYAVQKMWTASSTQTSLSAGGLIASATDLLGGSTTDLTSLPKEQAQKKEETAVASKEPFDAIIAVGALIKGSTMHFEYISDAVSHGLMKVQLETGCPVIFGLLTLLTEEQGLERAGIDKAGKGHNHGEDWGSAAVELGVKRRGWTEGKFIE